MSINKQECIKKILLNTKKIIEKKFVQNTNHNFVK